MKMILKKNFSFSSEVFAENGFSLTQLLIGLAVATVTILATIAVLFEILKSQKIENAHLTLNSLRKSLMAYFDNPYQRDLAYNSIQSQMADCIADSAACETASGTLSCPVDLGVAKCTGGGYIWQKAAPLVGGTTPVDYNPSSAPTLGFNLNERICSYYSSSSGNSQCPIRLDFSWEGECLTTTTPVCDAPTIKLSITFTFNGGDSMGYSINASKYNETLEF